MGINQKINICHLISGDLWAGAEVQAYTLLSSLKNDEDLNLLAVILNKGKLSEQLRRAGIETIVVDETQNKFSDILKILKEELKPRQIDIIHSHRYKENILAAQLKKKGLVRHLVQTVHGTGEQFKGLKRLKIALYTFLNNRQTSRYFDKVIAVSNDISGQLKSKLPPEKLVTIHNAIDIERIKPTRTSKEMRRELKLTENSILIGTAGRLVPVKGYDIFLETARYILDDKPQAIFLIAGDGPLKEELHQKAKTLGIDQNVRFLGFREDIIDFLNCLDIFIMSSHHEGIPMILLEAMVLGKPVVSTAVGGIKEVIEDNLSGLLVKPGDIKGLALACLILLNRPDTETKLSLGAQKRIMEEFSVTMQKNRILALYHNLAGRI